MTSDWKECKLGDLISIKHGYAFKGDFITSEDNGVVLVTPGNFAIGGGFQENKCKFYTDAYPKDYVLKENDLIVTMTDLSKDGDTLGYSAKIPKSNNRIYLHNQRIGLVEINSKEIDKDYLYWFMRTRNYQKTIVGSCSGSVIKHTSPGRICEIEIYLPSLETQRKIARVLGAIDDKIELNNSINKNLEQQAQAIFKSWFIDFEPFGGTMPEDWEILNLEDVCNISAGGDKPKEVSKIRTDKYSIPIYSNGIDNEGLYGYTIESKIIKESVTISARGTIGYTCLRLEPYVPIVRLITVEPKDNKISAKYLYHAIKKMNIVGYGTTQQQITVPYCKMLNIIIPTQVYMDKFTTVANSIYKIIYENKKENSRLTQLRDTLLPKLMNGEIDVDKVEV